MIGHFTRMALKAFRRFKLHTAISMLSLVVGFGCFISAVLLANYADSFDRHWPNADRIYNVIIRAVGDSPLPDRFPIINQPTARYLRSAFPEIPHIARASGGGPYDVSIEGQAATVDTKFVEGDYFFSIFPVKTIAGLATGEPLPPNSAIISESAAQRLFGRTDVVGERLLLDSQWDVSIAAVSRQFENPSHLQSGITFFNTELYVPISLQDQAQRESIIASGGDPDADRWGNQSDYTYLEIPPDMAFSEAGFNERLDQFVQTYLPEERAEIQTFELLPVNELVPTQFAFITGGIDITDALVVTGALVLLIGCLNYSNLVIAQLSLRSQEIGVQKILGSRRSLILLQYCYESLLFLSVALIITLLLLIPVLMQLGNGGMLGVSPALLLDPGLWLTMFIAMVVIVAIAGGYPALRTAMVPLVSMMRPKGSAGYSGRLRALMVGTQFFISGTLMILAIVMFKQNQAMSQQLDSERQDPKLAITVPIDSFTVEPELLINELKAHSAVVSVTQVGILPWNISNSTSSYSRERDLNAIEVEISRHNVGYNYTQTIDQPLLAGRDFSRERSNDRMPGLNDPDRAPGPYAVILDDKAARSLGWESATAAIGDPMFLHIGPPSVPQEMAVEFTVIGAMSERKYEFIDFAAFGSGGNAYFLRPQNADYLIVKLSRDNLNAGLRHIDDTWSRLMPEVALQRTFMNDLFYETNGVFLLVSVSIGALSIFGFLVASIGLLGNATFITNIRQKEVGIRKVMGASSGRLLRMLLLDFAKPILIANAIAWPLGYVLATSYVSLFAARAEVNWEPFVLSLGLSALIAFAAVFSQSWKSARVRPAMVLRYE